MRIKNRMRRCHGARRGCDYVFRVGLPYLLKITRWRYDFLFVWASLLRGSPCVSFCVVAYPGGAQELSCEEVPSLRYIGLRPVIFTS